MNSDINSKFQLTEAVQIIINNDKNIGLYKVDKGFHSSLPENWDKDEWNKLLQKSYKERLEYAKELLGLEIKRIQ